MAVLAFVIIMIMFIPFAIYHMKCSVDYLTGMFLPKSKNEFIRNVKLASWHILASLLILCSFFFVAYTVNYFIEK